MPYDIREKFGNTEIVTWESITSADRDKVREYVRKYVNEYTIRKDYIRVPERFYLKPEGFFTFLAIAVYCDDAIMEVLAELRCPRTFIIVRTMSYWSVSFVLGPLNTRY